MKPSHQIWIDRGFRVLLLLLVVLWVLVPPQAPAGLASPIVTVGLP